MKAGFRDVRDDADVKGWWGWLDDADAGGCALCEGKLGVKGNDG